MKKILEGLSRRSRDRVSIKVIREARAREQDSRWFGSAGAVLLRRYHGKYVAVKNRRVVASSSTMRGLYRKLDRLDSGMVLIVKVERPTLLVHVAEPGESSNILLGAVPPIL